MNETNGSANGPVHRVQRGTDFGSVPRGPGSRNTSTWCSDTRPFAPITEAPAQKPLVAAKKRSSYTILVVDENERLARGMGAGLEVRGYAVKYANSITAALDSCKDSKIDFILLDADMVGGQPGRLRGYVQPKYDDIASLKEAGGDAKIVVIAVEPDESSMNGLYKNQHVHAVCDKGNQDAINSAVEDALPVRFAEKTNGRTVLIMTEDRDLTESFVETVKRSGYDTLTAATYAQVVENAPKADLILIERGQNNQGVDALARIKATNPDARVLVRSWGFDDSGLSALKAFDGVLPSFIGPNVLEKALAKHLPLAQKERDAPSTTKKSATILQVDDEEGILGVTKANLQAAGYTYIGVLGGEAGLNAYREAYEAGKSPDVVVSDRKMPGMDGPTMVAGIMKINAGARVIFVTADFGEDELKPMRDLRPFAILHKPFEQRELIAEIKRALGQ